MGIMPQLLGFLGLKLPKWDGPGMGRMDAQICMLGKPLFVVQFPVLAAWFPQLLMQFHSPSCCEAFGLVKSPEILVAIPCKGPPLLHLYFGFLSKPLTLEGGWDSRSQTPHLSSSRNCCKNYAWYMQNSSNFHPLHVGYAPMNTCLFETSMRSSVCFRPMQAYRLKNQQVFGNRFAYG